MPLKLHAPGFNLQHLILMFIHIKISRVSTMTSCLSQEIFCKMIFIIVINVIALPSEKVLCRASVFWNILKYVAKVQDVINFCKCTFPVWIPHVFWSWQCGVTLVSVRTSLLIGSSLECFYLLIYHYWEVYWSANYCGEFSYFSLYFCPFLPRICFRSSDQVHIIFTFLYIRCWIQCVVIP